MLASTSGSFQLRIALYRTTSIGDVVLATACLDLLERLAIPVAVTWLGRSPSLELVSAAYPTLKCLSLGRRDSSEQIAKTVASVKDVHLLIDLQTTLRSRNFCRLVTKRHGVPTYAADKRTMGRLKLVAGARLRGRLRTLPPAMRQCPTPQYRMMMQTMWDALAHHLPPEALIPSAWEEARPRLPLPEQEELPLWQKQLRFGRWLAVAPGAAHATKQAPLDVMTNLLESVRAATEGRLNLVFLGDEKDREVAHALEERLKWPGAVANLAGKLSLSETALALRESAIVVTNDSSLAHIAEAVGTPAAVLFGPTVEAFGFAPWRPESRAFSSALGCRPCSRHGKAPCRYKDKKCFRDLVLPPVVSHLASYAEGGA